MRVYLQMPAGDDRPPRFYHLLLQQDLFGGWSVIREWGRQGAAGRTQHVHYESREEAERALMAWRDAQVRSGYQVVFVQGEPYGGQ